MRFASKLSQTASKITCSLIYNFNQIRFYLILYIDLKCLLNTLLLDRFQFQQSKILPKLFL